MPTPYRVLVACGCGYCQRARGEPPAWGSWAYNRTPAELEERELLCVDCDSPFHRWEDRPGNQDCCDLCNGEYNNTKLCRRCGAKTQRKTIPCESCEG